MIYKSFSKICKHMSNRIRMKLSETKIFSSSQFLCKEICFMTVKCCNLCYRVKHDLAWYVTVRCLPKLVYSYLVNVIDQEFIDEESVWHVAVLAIGHVPLFGDILFGTRHTPVLLPYRWIYVTCSSDDTASFTYTYLKVLRKKKSTRKCL